MRVARDHPRSRGEHLVFCVGLLLAPGSSPLTRGALKFGGCADPPRGIIPAHAGSTLGILSLLRGVRDHPRSRGEHRPRIAADDRAEGSSPLTRGALCRVGALLVHGWIIPAHAGSTSPHPCGPQALTDHPRSRGEHNKGIGFWVGCTGSSPLTRGARQKFTAAKKDFWIIPAHAGSTSLVNGGWFPCSDHPRSRGEHDTLTAAPVEALGSSPLTRGALPCERGGLPAFRIIPAHAGSTP